MALKSPFPTLRSATPLRSNPQIDDTDATRPRRRLGNWQLTALDELSDATEHDSQLQAIERPVQAERVEVISDLRPAGFNVRRDSTSALLRRGEEESITTPPTAAVQSPSQLELHVAEIQTNPENAHALGSISADLHAHGAATPAAAPNPPTRPRPENSAKQDVASVRKTSTLLTRNLPNLPDQLEDFPLSQLGFTIPLPGESSLHADAREIVAQSGRELAAGHIGAAFDSCLLAIELVPEYLPIHARIAEIYAHQRSSRRASQHAASITKICDLSSNRDYLWMAQRVLLHAAPSSLDGLRNLVESLIDVKQVDQSVRYSSALVEILSESGLPDKAMECAAKTWQMAAGNEQTTLLYVVQLAGRGDVKSAIAVWRTAMESGADLGVAYASIAALIAEQDEREHWRLLGLAIDATPRDATPKITRAYQQTAIALHDAVIHVQGQAILLDFQKDDRASSLLGAVVSDSHASDGSRALATFAIARRASGSQRLAPLQMLVELLQDPLAIDDSVWIAFFGEMPNIEDLEVDLGKELLNSGSLHEATELLTRAHLRQPGSSQGSELLVEALLSSGRLGAALSVLDKLALSHRTAGRLDEMADVFKHMSSLAPDNLKVKTRLIDSFLQRGFVNEARVELIAKADLEEQSQNPKAAAASLQRSAELSWSMGNHDEAFALFKRLIALNPDDAGARSSVVNLYLQAGRIAEAAEHQRAIVNLSTRTGGPHEVIAALHQVIGLTPDDSSAYYQLGDLLYALGEHQQSEKVFKRLSTMDPTDHVARERVAEMALRREINLSQETTISI